MYFINTNASKEPLQYICQGEINKYIYLSREDKS